MNQKFGVKRQDSCVVPVSICLGRPAVGVNCHGFYGIQARQGKLDCRHRFEISSAQNHCYQYGIETHLL